MNRPYQTFVSSEALAFDGFAAVCWFITMKSNVNLARVMNISPGELYTFVFVQDEAGSHTFVWPSACINAAPINPLPNSTTVQNFIGYTGGRLYANIPSAGKLGTP